MRRTLLTAAVYPSIMTSFKSHTDHMYPACGTPLSSMPYPPFTTPPYPLPLSPTNL